jgi:hypothetical protein
MEGLESIPKTLPQQRTSDLAINRSFEHSPYA